MGRSPTEVVGVAALLGAGLVAGVVLGLSKSSGPAVSATSLVNSTEDSGVSVHVSGWVNAPGVVRLRTGAIAADAVEAAGGFRPGADTGQVNLATEVLDGEQLVIPPLVASGEASVSDGKIAINRASANELLTLPGVGPVLAQRIVDHRTRNGPFESVEDLLDVPGIGEAKLASFRDLIRP